MKKEYSVIKRKRRAIGFTLVEVIIASSIAAMVTVATLGFYMTNYKIGFVNHHRNLINADMRGFTGQLIRDGREANYFVLYDSIDLTDRDDVGDRQLDGESGDLLVFVSTVETGHVWQPFLITGYVAYYRAEEADSVDGLAPVRRYERNYEPGSKDPIEDLLPSAAVLQNSDRVIELSKGLADGRLFYSFWGRSVMVNGQIHHGNAAKRVTETYNFTVSPRG